MMTEITYESASLRVLSADNRAILEREDGYDALGAKRWREMRIYHTDGHKLYGQDAISGITIDEIRELIKALAERDYAGAR